MAIIQPSIERELCPGHFQRLFRFDNGFGASVVRGEYTYGGPEGRWELAVVRVTGGGDFDFELTYDTSITDDVIGWLDEDEVQALLTRIRDLPAVKAS